MPHRDETPITWPQAEPEHLEVERKEVSNLVPGLEWKADLSNGGRSGLVGYEGELPAWLAPREEPPGLDAILDGDRLKVRCIYPQSTPLVPPSIFPLDPTVPLEKRMDHSWHVNGDGSLCLLRSADDWLPGSTLAPLLVKASCWFVEYRLRLLNLITAMSDNGIAEDQLFDAVIREFSNP